MIAAIIQARTNSKRLPNKVFKPLCNKPLIWHVVNRLKYCKNIKKIILATTVNKNDDLLENWAIKNNILCYRGSEEDVLDRYYQTAKYFKIDTIVRITSDDPFKDSVVIDDVINLFQREMLDFANNNNPPTFPEGLDAEVFSFSALSKAAKFSDNPYEREHVTQHFYNNPLIFKQSCLRNSTNLSNLRWTIDTQQDWDMVEIIYNSLFPLNENFNMIDILNYLKVNPHISKINSGVKRSSMYCNSY